MAKLSQSITLVGRATTNPVVTFYESGSVCARLTMGIRGPKSANYVDYFDLELWGTQAQVAADHIKAGNIIGIIGIPTRVQGSENLVVQVSRLERLGLVTPAT